MPTEHETLGERVGELEYRLAHQERTIEQLNALMVEREARIEQLALQVDALRDRVRALHPPDDYE